MKLKMSKVINTQKTKHIFNHILEQKLVTEVMQSYNPHFYLFID